MLKRVSIATAVAVGLMGVGVVPAAAGTPRCIEHVKDLARRTTHDGYAGSPLRWCGGNGLYNVVLPCVSSADVRALREQGLSEAQILKRTRKAMPC
jgi:hypothetical protein